MKRILITRTDRIGDFVLATPVFQAVREKYPDAWISALTFVENRALIEGNPFVSEVILYDKKGSEHGWLGNFLFSRKLREKKFDTVIHLHATNRMHLVTWLAGIPRRIGWKRKCAWALTEALPDDKKEGAKHEAEYNFDLLRLIQVPQPAKLSPYFPLNEKAGRSLEELCKHLGLSPEKPWIAVHPSASCPSKRWPALHFAELLDRVAERYDAEILLIGGASERGLMAKIQESCRKARPKDLSGRLSLAMLGQLLHRSALLISNDSGPVHVAGAVGTPVISIFGRKQGGLSPARWRPLGESSRVLWKDAGCEVCLAHACQIHFLCLEIISPQEVFTAVQDFSSRLQ